MSWWWRFPLSQPTARPTDRDAATLEALWAKLAEPVGPDAYRAISLMAAHGDDTVSFVARRVKSVSAEAARIKSLIAELDHDEYAVRRRALLELFRLGPAAEQYLRTALGSGPSFEARKSIEQLLQACAKPYPALPEARRTARAIRVLELIGTDQSVAVLRDLAQGIAKAFATEQAQAALRRMGKSQQGAPKTSGANTQATPRVIEGTAQTPFVAEIVITNKTDDTKWSSWMGRGEMHPLTVVRKEPLGPAWGEAVQGVQLRAYAEARRRQVSILRPGRRGRAGPAAGGEARLERQQFARFPGVAQYRHTVYGLGWWCS
jgi:hypothetical protein